LQSHNETKFIRYTFVNLHLLDTRTSSTNNVDIITASQELNNSPMMVLARICSKKVYMITTLVLGQSVILVVLLLRAKCSRLEEMKFEGGLQGPIPSEDPRLIRYLQVKFLVKPSSLPYNLTPHTKENSQYLTESRFLGWEFLHYYIKYMFQEQVNGFFFEAGALDGEYNSNTLWLEYNLNWTGILVEPNPVSFESLIWKRRKAWLSNTCISEESHPRQAVMQSNKKRKANFGNRWMFEANTHEVGNIFSKNPEELEKSFSLPSYFTSQCFPLSTYFSGLNVSVVDLLSLDTQGNEWEAIQSLLTTDIIVRVLLIEHVKNLTDKSIDKSFVDNLQKISYQLVDHDNKYNYIFFWMPDPILKDKMHPQKFKRYSG
ncbi:unnamed protein product, partial [Meganyctiphanes norvegica]